MCCSGMQLALVVVRECAITRQSSSDPGNTDECRITSDTEVASSRWHPDRNLPPWMLKRRWLPGRLLGVRIETGNGAGRSARVCVVNEYSFAKIPQRRPVRSSGEEGSSGHQCFLHMFPKIRVVISVCSRTQPKLRARAARKHERPYSSTSEK